MRDINELDEHTQKYFKQVMAKDYGDLSKGEKDFIKAREEYLTSDLKEKYAELFKKKEDIKEKTK